MDSESENRVRRLGTGRRLLLGAIAAVIGLVVALTAAEFGLRYRDRYIAASDHMDSGLILYDRVLGWRLAPGWRGRHHNYDYDVTYTINPAGFRGREPHASERAYWAVIGDSFTFGLGVDDGQTFVHLLNAKAGAGDVRYLNFGVPGYSTDQEYLQLQRTVLNYSPKGVMLVVYLGNDLFDNLLGFPLQAGYAKPYYTLDGGRLDLRNTPVPLTPKPASRQRQELRNLAMGQPVSGGDSLYRFLHGLALVRLFTAAAGVSPAVRTEFGARFRPCLQLFYALVGAIHEDCRRVRAKLLVVLMPGRSYVERPESYSAAFQDYLRSQIAATLPRRGIEVYDLASALRARYRGGPGQWFYPHDGHLTPEGNRVVAALLRDRLRRDGRSGAG